MSAAARVDDTAPSIPDNTACAATPHRDAMTATPIPMVDLQAQYADLRGELEPAMAEAMAATQYIQGPNVQAFEHEAATYLGVRHALGCASGTDALHLALAALGVGAGDEVITTPFTFIATAEAIRYTGATPRFVDIDPGTYNLDVAAVERALSPRTRAVLPVHLFGQPVDMGALLGLCEARGLLCLEDCAQSFGARVQTRADADGRQTGALGRAGAFSFFPSKNLGGFGDGGLVSTNEDAVAERIRSLRNHGQTARYHHAEIGYNSRLDELQAVVLRHKLAHIDHYNAQRRRVAARYDRHLTGVVTTPKRAENATHVFHQYTILTQRRDAVMAALKEAGIASAIYYPVPLHHQPAFIGDSPPPTLPHAESVAGRCLSLPIYPELTDADVDRIGQIIRDVHAR
jgi:dTDP-4-amino-4,6-dideoxygalactose transaminase